MFLLSRHLTVIACCLAVLSLFVGTEAKPRPKRSAVKAAANKKQVGFISLIVNGRELAGPNSTARRVAGKVTVPIAAVANALGDRVNADPAERTVTVSRQSGITSVLDIKLGQVRADGAVILTIADQNEIAFASNPTELMLPAEIASVLLDAAITYDATRDVVIVNRGFGNLAALTTAGGRSFAEIYKADYEYNFSGYSSFAAHDLQLNAAGRIGDARFFFMSNANMSTGRALALRTATFTLERPNGQRFAAGDIGAGNQVRFLSTNLRGGVAGIPVGGLILTAFGGRVNSGASFQGTGEQVVKPAKSRFDTNAYGFYVKPKNQNKRTDALDFAAGAILFYGPERRGETIAGSASYNGRRLNVVGDFGLGRFKGHAANGSTVDGIAAAAEVSATFQVREDLTVQGRYSYIGRNFLSPQAGFREPVHLRSAGVNWSPKRWLSASLNASVISRPGDAAHQDKALNAGLNITPMNGLPRIYVSHTQTSSRTAGSSAFTLLNVSRDFSRWRLFVNATRVKTAGSTTLSTQVGSNFTINDTNSLEMSQSIGSHRNYNGQIDWRTANLFAQRLSFSVGGGYSYSAGGGIKPYERLTASVRLPRETSFQVNYINASNGQTLLVSLRGTLFRKRDSARLLDGTAQAANLYAGLRGRVYQDVNLNGVYDVGVDKPQAEVKIRIDGNRYVVSDASGEYKFETVVPGDHKVYIDLTSVRADLTLLTGGEQEANLAPSTNSSMDFRLVRTGRLHGRVWLDGNENGKFDEGETPLADIRVFTKSGRDTLTDADGFYTLGDLAPGEHTVMIDAESLPEKTILGSRGLTLQVYPGREMSDADLTVINIPVEVKRFGGRPL